MKLKTNPYHRNKKLVKSTKIDTSSLCILQLRDEYFLSLTLGDMTVRGNPNPEDVWNNLKEMIHESFGKRQRKDLGWYTAYLEAIIHVMEKNEQTLLRMKSNPLELRACCAET